MGFYLETESVHGKAKSIAEEWQGEIVYQLPTFTQLNKENKVLVTVVDNGPFEAAGICYSQGEYDQFTSDRDPRPREYVVLDKDATLKAFAKDNNKERVVRLAELLMKFDSIEN